MKNNVPNTLVGSTFIFSVIMLGATFLIQGVNEDALRMTLRETASVSFTLFILVFVASSLHQVFNNGFSKWLMKNRRYLGVSFAVSHLIHLSLIVWLVFDYAEGNLYRIAPLSSYIFGGIGYGFLVAMLITSNNYSLKRMGFKRWKGLHKSGMYCLFLIFFITYLGLLEQSFLSYSPCILALSLAFCLRGVTFMIKQRRARAL